MSEFTEDLRAVGAAAHEDMEQASAQQKLGLLATGIGLAAHQLGMEAALFAVGTHAYVAGHEAGTWVAPFAAAAANGIFSYATEATLTQGTAKGLDSFSGAMTEIGDRFLGAKDEKANEALENLEGTTTFMQKFDNVLVAAGAGSAATVLMDYKRHPNASNESHRQVGMRFAKFLSKTNVILALSVGGSLAIGEELGTDKVFNGLEAVADSPWTYGAFAAIVGARLVAAVTGRHNRSDDPGTDTPEQAS